ncbi:13072_t:CDS:2 [Dentiscutata erythropus]|uniref:13072_t:CDS:1 n=1 Tax=Dentiscutata erythropus TaxID=1348616 RepID=A0A9N9BWA3_9GLOM|nr:13072_t:CDS:2 [Dentiscutata erythropus]
MLCTLDSLMQQLPLSIIDSAIGIKFEEKKTNACNITNVRVEIQEPLRYGITASEPKTAREIKSSVI